MAPEDETCTGMLSWTETLAWITRLTRCRPGCGNPHDLAPYPALIRVILETRWDADEWPIVKAELRNAMAERTWIERAGWFN